MKKSFTFLFVLSLLTVFGSLSVKANPIVKYFGYHDGEWTPDGTVAQPSECCAGYIAASDKIVTGSDFYYSGKHQDAVERDGDNWTGFNGSNGTIKACTRTAVSLSASTTYTFSLLTKDKGEMDITLPKISIDGTNYVGPQKVLVNSVEQSFSNNQYRYTNNEETVLEYSITAPSSSSYTVSVQFTSGYRDKFKASTLTITQNAATYDVTVNNDGNGTASADKAKYEAGETVTLTAEPNANYLFNGWTTSDDGFSFVDGQSASTTFTMPAKAVTVQANFVACSGETVTVVADNDDHGTVTGSGSYCANARVDIAATPKSGYRFVNWTVTSGSASLDNENNASTHFTMSNPAAAVTVQANFEVDPCTNSKTIQCEDYDPEITKPSVGHSKPSNYMVQGYRISGNDEGYGTAYGDAFASFRESGDTEIFYYLYLSAGTYTFTVRCSNGNTKKVVLYNAAGDTKLQELVLGSDYDNNTWHEYTTSSWTAASSAYYYIGLRASNDWAAFDQMTITATSNVFCPNTITMAKSGDDGAAASTAQVNSSNVTTAFEGATVTVTAGAPSANHNFVNWTATPTVEFLNANASSTTFVMPANAVTITANYEASVSRALTFSAGEGGSITSATAGGDPISSGDEVISGTSVTLTAAANSNYVFINWTDDNKSDAVVSTNAAFTFSMPATATSYTAHFAQIDNVIITGDVASTAGFDGDGSGTMNITSVADFDAFNHEVLKFAYSNMDGGKYKGQKVAIDEGYSSSASAQATGFGFYYKTEKADDHVAFCFEVSSGEQVKWQLAATNNEWKYFYFPHAGAASWNGEHITIFMNGDDTGNYSTWNGQGTHTTYKDGGAFYMSEIAATSITSKPDIDSYTYTRANTSNSYGTLCLPMAGTIEGATLYSVAGKQEEGGKLYIVLEEQGDALAAGEPYIFETDGSPLTATMSGPHRAVNADANGLVGTYQQITAPAYNGSDNLNYVLARDNSNNTVFMKVGEEVTVGAYRAYINIKNAGDYSPASAVPGRKYIRFGIEGTEEAQAVEMIYDDASLRTRKIMQNGHLYILRDGHLFTAQGTQIK